MSSRARPRRAGGMSTPRVLPGFTPVCMSTPRVFVPRRSRETPSPYGTHHSREAGLCVQGRAINPTLGSRRLQKTYDATLSAHTLSPRSVSPSSKENLPLPTPLQRRLSAIGATPFRENSGAVRRASVVGTPRPGHHGSTEPGTKPPGPQTCHVRIPSEDRLIEDLLLAHQDMVSILPHRHLRLQAALVQLRRDPLDLVAFLYRQSDHVITCDLLPVMSERLSTDPSAFGLTAMCDLLPAMQTLLTSKYDKQTISVMKFLTTTIRAKQGNMNSPAVVGGKGTMRPVLPFLQFLRKNKELIRSHTNSRVANVANVAQTLLVAMESLTSI